MTDERWIPILGFEGYYEVSDYGRVRSVDRIVGGMGDHHLKGKQKAFCLSGPKCKKYYYVNLYKDCKGKLYAVHRFVGILFVPNPNNYKLLNHKDHNQLNNHWTNLEWVNFRENVSHAGFKNNKSKVTGVQKYEGKRKTRWSSVININRHVKYLGTFDTQEQASNAYKKALQDHNLTNRYA